MPSKGMYSGSRLLKGRIPESFCPELSISFRKELHTDVPSTIRAQGPNSGHVRQDPCLQGSQYGERASENKVRIECGQGYTQYFRTTEERLTRNLGAGKKSGKDFSSIIRWNSNSGVRESSK